MDYIVIFVRVSPFIPQRFYILLLRLCFTKYTLMSELLNYYFFKFIYKTDNSVWITQYLLQDAFFITPNLHNFFCKLLFILCMVTLFILCMVTLLLIVINIWSSIKEAPKRTYLIWITTFYIPFLLLHQVILIYLQPFSLCSRGSEKLRTLFILV